eukprot:10214787-Alexandrium_andersonii.AAC.1
MNYFCLPAVPAEVAQQMQPGLQCAGPWVWPRLRIVPMGWSWAFFLGQKVIEHAIATAVHPEPPFFVRDWGNTPDLADGAVAYLPDCDNVNVLGTDSQRVQEQLDII